MRNRLAGNLSVGKKLLLAAVAVAAAAGPFLFGIVSARAQTAPSPALHFDVDSVKIQHNGTGGAWDNFPVNGTWSARAMSIPSIVGYAYNVDHTRVEGIPKTLQGPDPGFNIIAKAPLKTSRKDFRLMMQSLLADRFKAVIHTEIREIPVNTIEVAKGGVKLQPASGQCVEVEGNAAVSAGQHRCHEVLVRAGMSNNRMITWEYSGWSVSMAELAATLSNNSLVVDDTGLSGLYDFDVKIESPPGNDDPESKNDFAYYWNAAWEKQAGLVIDKGKTKRRPAPVVVVDHIELPAAN